MTVKDNCTTGDVRLASFNDSTVSFTREGRLEMCINSAWGSVCETLFDTEDASVACGQLDGFSTGGL